MPYELTAEQAERELALAARQNPGPWEAHSRNVGLAARRIAAVCPTLDEQQAYLCGLLHDIGRRNGVSAMRHTIDGYDYAMANGWPRIARVCLTHSFPTRDADADIARRDITEEQYQFIKQYLQQTEYDEYDKLIILCDALADADGFCLLEKRLVDTSRRYGLYPFTLDRWNSTFAYKEHFEALIGASVYTLLPGIERCLYR